MKADAEPDAGADAGVVAHPETVVGEVTEQTVGASASGSELERTGEEPEEPAATVTASDPQDPQPQVSQVEQMRKPGEATHSLEEAFEFWSYSLDVLCQGKDQDEQLQTLEDLAAAVEADSMSTAYSGVRAPETAMALWRWHLEERLGRKLKRANEKMGHMIEWNTQSQRECILMGKREDSCVFADISQFWRPELKADIIPSLLRKPAMSIQVLAPLILQGTAVQLRGWCVVHNRHCVLKSCVRHLAGTSCKGFSRRGCGLGVTDSDAVHFLCWCALRRALQEADITQENVAAFPVEVLQTMLGDMYHLEPVILEAASFGTPTMRTRQFVRLRHRIKVLTELSPLTRFNRRFVRCCQFHWEEWLG